MRTLLLVVATWVTSFVLIGCDAPIVGDWRSDKKLANGERNKLNVWGDNTGNAIIYATPDYDHTIWTKFKFDVVWEDEGEEFDLKMDCRDGPCDGDDFTMECKVIDEGDDKALKLGCDGNKKWSDYPLDWEEWIID